MHMKFHPSREDMEKYKTPLENRDREKQIELYHYASSIETYDGKVDDESSSNIAEVKRDITEVVEGEMSTLKERT